MRKWVLLGCLALLTACASQRLEETEAPPAIPPLWKAESTDGVKPVITSRQAVYLSTGSKIYEDGSGNLTFDDGIGDAMTLQSMRAAAAVGDVNSVGDCASGACLDGTSDGGTYVRLYDGDSNYTQIAAGNSSADLTFTLPTAYPGAANAIMVSSTAGVLSTVAATTYLTPSGDGSGLSGVVTSESDPTALLTAGTDNVKDTHIDWGAGAGQVDGADVPFADTDSNWTATTIGGALEELDDVINGGVPNDATGKVDWSQLTNVPAGFADGTDADSGGATAYDAIGDPTGAGSISFDDGETATYDGAWDTEVAITISLNAADLVGDTTGLLITSVDNDDPNFIPLLIQDDQDGTPDDLFKVDYQGVATATGGFVGNLTGDASGSAASITGDLDPDQLSGDGTDDDLVDQDIIEGLSASGVATPGFTAYDSGAPGADKEIGKIYWNDDGTGGDGTEDGDFFIQAMVAGTDTDIISFDNSIAMVTISQDLTVTGSDILVGAAGVKISGDGDGAVTFLGLGDGSDEDLTMNLDDTSDTVVFSSSTGVTTLSFSALNLTTTGNLQAGITTNTDANGMTQGEMTTAGVYGTMFWATGAGTWNLPAVASGMSLCVYSTTAAAVVVNPDNADRIRLNGAALSDGDSITSESAAGDFICLMYDSADGWTTLGKSGAWTDTN